MFKAVHLNVVRSEENQKNKILNDINFTFTKGKTYTILGKNGSGKTTLIKSLTKLLNKNTFHISGSVLWKNKNLLNLDILELQQVRRYEIRYVLQDLTANFDPLKKLKYYFDNSALTEQQITEQLKNFLLPKYDIISNLHSYEISGGMAQRFSLMLALSANPKLLILDEPTSAIDYTNINLVNLKLNEFRDLKGITLAVTQDINFARKISDEIAFLYEGELSNFKPTEEFFNNSSDTIQSSFINSYREMK